jgi:hypothetical protein
VVVEELLQLLVGEVDAELLKAVELQGGGQQARQWVSQGPLSSVPGQGRGGRASPEDRDNNCLCRCMTLTPTAFLPGPWLALHK